MSNKPAILGGTPLAEPMIPFVRPVLPSLEELSEEYNSILHSGMVTTGPYAELLGEAIAKYLGVRHAIAVSSCTTGLLLATQALNLPEGSEVILPSFTFMASALGPVWNRLKLRFVDVDRDTINIDPTEVDAAVTPNTSAIIGVHQFGNPAPVEELQAIADRYGLALYFDSAHGFGAMRSGKFLGRNGRVEVFSMTPTKLLIAAEGGIVATNDEAIANHVRWGRNYANPGNYDCLFPGINARLSEMHAILALHSLKRLEEAATVRNRIVRYYRERLGVVPGVEFQKISEEDRSSYKDFTIILDEKEFGLTQKQLGKSLLADGVQSRVYYAPVLHKMTAFKHFYEPMKHGPLENTHYLESHALSLPLFNNMREGEAEVVCEAIERIFSDRKEIEDLIG